MADPDPNDPVEPDPPPSGDPAPTDPATPTDDELEKFADPAKARDAVRESRSEAAKYRTRLREVEAELDEARKAQLSDAERAIDDARSQGRAEALAEVSQQLIAAEVRAAASGVLVDPDVAVHLLDLSSVEVADDGSFDTDAITAAVNELAEQKPYLAAKQQKPDLPSLGGGGGAPAQGGQSINDLLRQGFGAGG